MNFLQETVKIFSFLSKPKNIETLLVWTKDSFSLAFSSTKDMILSLFRVEMDIL